MEIGADFAPDRLAGDGDFRDHVELATARMVPKIGGVNANCQPLLCVQRPLLHDPVIDMDQAG